MEILDINELEDFFILTLDTQFRLYSYEMRENFKLLQILIKSYNLELEKRLVLSRKIDLIEFFLSIEKKMLYFIHCFQKINNPNVKNKIYFYIQKIRLVNRSNIIKFV